MSAILYLEHLSDADLALLAAVADAGSPARLLRSLHASPDSLGVLLGDPALFATLFRGEAGNALLRASPFLAFAVLIHRATRDLAERRFVEEWIGPNRRVPMFEVADLRDFLAAPLHRLFLAELLASYTRVASGSVWIHTPRGWRRRRYSELDPLRLIDLLATLPEGERPALYRRLGDLALFLTGVFPDHAGRHVLAPLQQARLRRALDWNGGEESGGITLLEDIGRLAYRSAWQATVGAGNTGSLLHDMAQGFAQARRVLNFATDRYLFPRREEWFPLLEN